MSNQDNHPEFEDLLQYLDQGGTTRPGRLVQHHLSGCWKCRARVEEIESTVRDFASYHDKMLLPALPSAARSWPDLRPALRQYDEANPELGAWSRIAHTLRGPASPARRSIVAGLALAGVALALTWSARAWLRPAAAPPAVAQRAVERTAPVPQPSVASLRRPVAAAIPARRMHTLELLAFVALHRAGADLGDPVEVLAEPGGAVRVRAIGLPPERQAVLRDALAATPQVQIDFGAPPAVHAARAEGVTVVAGRRPFQAQLQRILGADVTSERYGNRVLDESDAVLARAHALAVLAERFPAARRASFDANERALLKEIERAHLQALSRHASDLYHLLAPVRDGLGKPQAIAVPAGTRALDAARHVDRVASVLFGAATTDQSLDTIAAELTLAMAELKSATEDRR